MSAALLTLMLLAGLAPNADSQSVTAELYLDEVYLGSTLAWAPDGRLFLTELQTGDIHVVENDVFITTPFATLDVELDSETGLIGLTFDQGFLTNGFVYVWYQPADSTFARVSRYTAVGNTGTDFTHLIQLPAAPRHNGGTLRVGPDNMLYVSIGDNLDPANSQNTSVLPGKILRYNLDGTIPDDNPSGPGNPAYAWGFRNPYQYTFHPTSGVIYSGEVGPNCDDELNRVVPGGNYGWRPGEPCGEVGSGFIEPLHEWTPVVTPTGITFYTGSVYPQYTGDLFVGTFNSPPSIYRFRLGGPDLDIVEEVDFLLENASDTFILDVAQGPDGYLYFTDVSHIYRIVPTSTGVAEAAGAAPDGRQLTLAQARPNPSRTGSSVTLPFSLEAAASVDISLHDASGRLVRSFGAQERAAGQHHLVWDGRDSTLRPVAAGVYFYRVEAGNDISSRRIVVVR